MVTKKQQLEADKRIKEIVKRRLNIAIAVNILILVGGLTIYFFLLDVGLSIIRFRTWYAFSNLELTNLFFALLGLDFIILSVVIFLPIAHRINILVYLMKKRCRKHEPNRSKTGFTV